MNKFIKSMIESLEKKGYYNIKYNEYLNLLVYENDDKTIYLSNIPIDNQESIKEQQQNWLDGRDIYVVNKVKEQKQDDEPTYTFEYFKKDMLEIVKYFNIKAYSISSFNTLHTFYKGDENIDTTKKNQFNFICEIEDVTFLVNYCTDLSFYAVYAYFGDLEKEITDCQCLEQVKETIKKCLEKSKKQKGYVPRFDNVDELLKLLGEFIDELDK